MPSRHTSWANGIAPFVWIRAEMLVCQPAGLAESARHHGISCWRAKTKTRLEGFRPRCAQTQVQRMVPLCRPSVALSSAPDSAIASPRQLHCRRRDCRSALSAVPPAHLQGEGGRPAVVQEIPTAPPSGAGVPVPQQYGHGRLPPGSYSRALRTLVTFPPFAPAKGPHNLMPVQTGSRIFLCLFALAGW